MSLAKANIAGVLLWLRFRAEGKWYARGESNPSLHRERVAS